MTSWRSSPSSPRPCLCRSRSYPSLPSLITPSSLCQPALPSPSRFQHFPSRAETVGPASASDTMTFLAGCARGAWRETILLRERFCVPGGVICLLRNGRRCRYLPCTHGSSSPHAAVGAHMCTYIRTYIHTYEHTHIHACTRPHTIRHVGRGRKKRVDENLAQKRLWANLHAHSRRQHQAWGGRRSWAAGSSSMFGTSTGA